MSFAPVITHEFKDGIAVVQILNKRVPVTFDVEFIGAVLHVGDSVLYWFAVYLHEIRSDTVRKSFHGVTSADLKAGLGVVGNGDRLIFSDVGLWICNDCE